MTDAENETPMRMRADDRDGVQYLDIPFTVLVPHEAQCQGNHGQSLRRIRERGGFGASEALAVLEDRPWRPMDEMEAFDRVHEIVRNKDTLPSAERLQEMVIFYIGPDGEFTLEAAAHLREGISAAMIGK